MKIIFVRHGQTEWNVLDKVQGRVDIELNEIGKNQAKEIAIKLINEKIDLIVCSPLSRAIQTAEIINDGRNIPIIIDEGVSERCFGVLEGEKRSLVEFGVYWDKDANLPIEKGECLSDFLERINNFVKRLKERHDEKTVLVVSHGGVSIALQYIFKGLAEDGYLPKGIKNCEILKYTY